jgi:hypothetical protein
MSSCVVAEHEDEPESDYVLIDADNGLNVIPRSILADIALGKLSINELDGYESIIKAMIGDLIVKGVL